MTLSKRQSNKKVIVAQERLLNINSEDVMTLDRKLKTAQHTILKVCTECAKWRQHDIDLSESEYDMRLMRYQDIQNSSKFLKFTTSVLMPGFMI